MIASTHGGFFHTAQFAMAKKLWFNTVTRASIQAYHRIVACSHSDAELFRSRSGNRLTVIENGIDQARFTCASAPVQTRTIICFGRFAKHKRIDEIFPILARLYALDPAWRLIIAGRDADQTAEQLSARADETGILHAVRFVLNPSDAQLRLLIGEASFSACLSAYEGFGLAAVEAMSAGLLPILSGIAPFRRLVDDTKIGLIVDPGDPVGAAAIVQSSVLDDATSYAQRREQTMETVRRYDWEEVATRYADIYAEAIGATQGVPITASLRSGV
jgi:alpha-1,3-mannosyltransferase